MSDTPRTDEVAFRWDVAWSRPSEVLALARDLERELNQQVLANGKGSEREAALLAKVERLERENAALRAHKERLDWIVTQAGTEWLTWQQVAGSSMDYAVIDAARKEAQP